MKTELHPVYQSTTITCTCGAVYETRSTVENMKVGICMQCHPFFTGEQRFVDTAGRVEKFAKRYGSMQARRATKEEAPAEVPVEAVAEEAKEEAAAASA
jgi:large subunit ribosomal protein L31